MRKPVRSLLLQIGLFAILFVFLILPLIFMLFKVSAEDLSYVFSDEVFYKSILNSLLYSLISTVVSVILAAVVAYYLSRIKVKGKKWFVILLTLPMLIPTISIGLGVRTLFGVNGFLDQLFGLKFDGLGMFDLIVGSVVFSFPVAFLLIYDAFLYEDRSIYDAANTLGISRIRTIFGITLPYLRTTLISAFFASFTLIFADYGLPMEVAGKVKTLPMYLYEQVLSMFQYGRGAVISLVLLVPAIIAFLFDILSKDSSDGSATKEVITPHKSFNIVGLIIVCLVGAFLFIPSLAFVTISFVTRFPSDMSFTFQNYVDAFSPYTSVSIVDFLINSLVISLFAGVFGTTVAYVSAYVSTRTRGKMAKPLHFLSIATLAVPGLVLGIGYVFLFADTSGWFAGTLAILIVVNIVHYFSSPYLMAKNAFEKINRNYETVADTLGISHFSLFFKVMIPNSISTIVQMFSYLFINSMITISAVSFLCTYKTQPLSVSITTYENQSIWEMESVISSLILVINLGTKIGFDYLSKWIEKINKGKVEQKMELTRFQFNLLTYIEEHNKEVMTQRQMADGVTLSLGTTNKLINQFIEDDLVIIHSNKSIELTEKGYKALEPYKVRKAIVIAAGFGSRMVPVTLDTPKPLVKVNGVRIIDTLLDALYAIDIKNITIVVGYKKEQFQQLLEKYPTLKFIENPIYNESNNISSVYAALDIIDRCYICEADLVISNPKVITKYQYCSNYLGAYVSETDDWCFFKKGNYIDRVSVGGENCWHMIGISYWNEKDSKKLREDIVKVFNSRGGKEKYWDNVPLTICKKNFNVEVRECKKDSVSEIDSFAELAIIDPIYLTYSKYDYCLIKKCSNYEDKDKIINYLRKNILFSGYILPNIEHYGFEDSNFSVFFMEDHDQNVVLVITKYFNSSHLVCFTETNVVYKKIADFMIDNKIKRVSGPSKVIYGIKEFLPNAKLTTGRVALLTNEISDYRFGKFTCLKATTEKDFNLVAGLICEDESFGKNYSIEELTSQLSNRYKIRNGRNYFIVEDGQIITHAGTYSEGKDVCVISGVKTKKCFEKKGYGTSVVAQLKNDLVSEGKKVIIYFYHEYLNHFYETFGYDVIDECAKIELF